MSQYAGSNTFPTSFEEVDDGTVRDAASVNVGLEALADRTVWLKSEIDGTNPSDIICHSLTATDHVTAPMVNVSTQLTVSGDASVAGDASVFGQLILANGPHLTITNATNATPIVVTTSTAHGLVDGQEVTISLVGGNTAANDQWVVHVTGSATFSLVGSSGSGAYTSGGIVSVWTEPMFNTPRSVNRVLSRFWSDGTNGGATQGWNLLFPGDGVFHAWNSSPTTNQQTCGFEIGTDDAPQGSQLNSATVYVQPNTGHGGVPSTLPSIAVYKRSLKSTGSTGTSLASGVITPTPGSAGAYEVYTPITATLGTAEILDHSRFRYLVILATEIGTHALDGLQVFGASINITAPAAVQF